MKREHTYKNLKTDPGDLSSDLFSHSKIPWEKSKEEIWKDLYGNLHEEDRVKNSVSRFLPRKQWLAVAASIALLLAGSGFLRFYSVSSITPAGEHASLRLPDGSTVELNAETTLKYHPYWWRITRSVEFEGEAFFKVIPGSKFKVVSPQTFTEVLGTSFNIFARELEYNVACHSGKVRVTARSSNDNVLLTPNKHAHLDQSGSFKVASADDQEDVPAWTNNLLMFASTPLRLVFDEIERQYGIKIVTPEGMHLSYSGNFALDASLENILTLLCLPFDLLYEQTSGNTYTISPSPVD